MNFLITRKLGDIISWGKPFDFLDGGCISGTEIMLSKPELINVADIQEVKKKCEGLYLTAHLPFYDLNLASVDSFISGYSMEVMINGLDFCRKLNIKRAVAHLGYNVKLAGKAASKWKTRFFEEKRKLETEAWKKNVQIVWENTYEENFELFDEMLKVDPETLFCLDVGHCNCFSDFTAIQFIDRYRENVVHLHLHDNNGNEDSHMAPGMGSIDFISLFRVVKMSKIENAVFEIKPRIYLENRNMINNLFKVREK